jgi:hypothetical protein
MKLVAAVDRDEIEALEGLKATNQIITSSLQNDLLLLQGKFKNLTTDYEQQKSHLVDALLAKDKLRQELATLTEGKDLAGEENNTALQALKEVSHEIDFSDNKCPPRLHSFLPIPHDPYLDPCVRRAEHPTGVAKMDEAVPALERKAVGVMEISKMDNIDIAIPIPHPMSPLHLRPPRVQIFRAMKWTEDEWEDATTVADNIHSKPRNKKRLFKTSNDVSKLPRKPEQMRKRCRVKFRRPL